jgi:hypothetical protein
MASILIGLLIIGAPVVLSIYSTLGVFYPQIRMNWRGSTKPVGKIASIGAALFCDAAVLIVLGGLLLPAWVMDRLVLCLLAIILMGFILIVLGYFRDMSSKP